MRIPVGSCEGCNQDAELTPSGAHPLGDGHWMRCKFIEAEMSDIKDVGLVAVYDGWQKGRKKAYQHAKRVNGAIHWIGQAPYDIWLVLRDLSI